MRNDAPTGLREWALSLVALAGLEGAAGVVAAAAAAHLLPVPQLQTAAHMLLFHAPLVVALAAFGPSRAWPRSWLLAGTLVLAGAALFSADVALFAVRGHHLFHMAAPTGGSMLILSWLLVSALALAELLFGRRRPPST